MAFKMKGFPEHKVGAQPKNNGSPVKAMSESGKATLSGVGMGAASGAAAGAALGPWGAAVGAVIGGVVGGVTADKQFKEQQEMARQEEALARRIKTQEEMTSRREKQQLALSDRSSTSVRLPGKTENINPDGTVSNSTSVTSKPMDLGSLYSPSQNSKNIAKKGYIKKTQGEKITEFNSNSINIANEPTGTNVSINKKK
jgi:gas vesicle protein